MSFIVKQPRANGLIHLFLTESHRVENKPYPVQKRTYLGVLDSDSSELLLARDGNKPSPEVIKLLQEKGISFSGRRHSRKERKQAPMIDKFEKVINSSSCLETGRIALLEHLAVNSGLLASLNASFGAEDSRRIFAAAAYECCEGGALCRLQDWAEGTSLHEEDMALSASSVTRLSQDLGADLSGRNDFFREWFKASGSPRALVSDTTSISSYAEKLSLVEWGYNRDQESLPQVNLNMVYSSETHTPLYYRLIFGSVPDVCTLTATSNTISELGLKSYNFSLDRGFFSVANLLHFHDSELGYTIGVPMSGNQEAERLFERNKQKLRSFKSAVVYDNVTLNHVSDTYRIVKLGKRGERTRIVKTTAHIYLNKCRRAQQEKELVELLHGIMKEFSRHTFTELKETETWLETVAGNRNKRFFSVRKARENAKNPNDRYLASADGGFQICVAERAYVSAVKHFGTFMILNSDPSADGEQTLRDNRSRECQEKVFDILKNSTGNDRLRASGDASVEGRLFIAFIAVTLHKLLENELRRGECLGTVSINKALDLMRKIRVGIFADGARIPYEIPLKTRKLLENIAPDLLESITGKKPPAKRPDKKSVVTSNQ
jgi:transposase